MDYKEEIIDHYKYPRNFGDLEDPKVTVDENNSSCGDMVEIYARLDNDQRILVMKWRGVGCAISTAAASMLSEKVVGMGKEDLEKFREKGVVELLGGDISAGRMKCATLAYRALLKVFGI
ncbi:iron-sulfur cluster assembly scaffold protein [Candidatus Collierbacteria bacterium]|nr:iron-sulfur cluster assembly scaffold protein [Candidatus Collierbacteria bacterium]